MPETTMGLDLLDQLLLLIVAGVAIPFGAWLKDKTLNPIIRPEFAKAIIAVGAAFGLCALLSCGLGAAELIERSLQAVGEGAIIYGATRAAKKTVKKR